MKRTAIVRDFQAPLGRSKLAAIKGPLFESQVNEEGRPATIWRRMFYHKVPPDLVDALAHMRSDEARKPRGHAEVMRALSLTDDDEAASLALSYIGVTAAAIMRGPKTWTFPTAAETGEPALVVPVGGRCTPVAECLSLLGSHTQVRDADPGDIGDLVAICVSDGRALSFNGTTASIGAFAVGDEGRVRISADGIRWLRKHGFRARALAEVWPAHLVAQRLPLPDRIETLLIDRSAFSFRLEDGARCAIPPEATQVICADSAALSEFIASEMKARVKLRQAPLVLGPKQ